MAVFAAMIGGLFTCPDSVFGESSLPGESHKEARHVHPPAAGLARSHTACGVPTALVSNIHSPLGGISASLRNRVPARVDGTSHALSVRRDIVLTI